MIVRIWMHNDNLITFNRFGNYSIINIKILNQIKDQHTYHKKITEFIGNNNFTSIKGDLNKWFQKELRINECCQIIQKDIQWKYISLNPSASTIRGLIKIHKVYSPFRPLVNWTNAPVYKLAKMLSKKLEIYIPLPNLLNVKNTIQLMKDLLEIPFTKI